MYWLLMIFNKYLLERQTNGAYAWSQFPLEPPGGARLLSDQ